MTTSIIIIEGMNSLNTYTYYIIHSILTSCMYTYKLYVYLQVVRCNTRCNTNAYSSDNQLRM